MQWIASKEAGEGIMIKRWEERFDIMDFEHKSCHSGESLAMVIAKDAEIEELREFVRIRQRLDTLRSMHQLDDLDIVGWNVCYPELAAEIVELEAKL